MLIPPGIEVAEDGWWLVVLFEDVVVVILVMWEVERSAGALAVAMVPLATWEERDVMAEAVPEKV